MHLLFEQRGNLTFTFTVNKNLNNIKQQAYSSVWNSLVLFRKARKPKYSPAHQSTYVRTQTSATHFYKPSSSNKVPKRISCYKNTANLLSLLTRKTKLMTS